VLRVCLRKAGEIWEGESDTLKKRGVKFLRWGQLSRGSEKRGESTVLNSAKVVEGDLRKNSLKKRPYRGEAAMRCRDLEDGGGRNALGTSRWKRCIIGWETSSTRLTSSEAIWG